MNGDQAIAVEQQVYRFWAALDRRDYDAMLDMMAEDCSWLRGEWLSGKASIRAALDARPADLVIRHVVTNILVDANDDRVLARYYVTAFGATAEVGRSGPLPAAPPMMLADVSMEILGADERWRIRRIEPSVVFRANGH